jgi:hypothetical protein
MQMNELPSNQLAKRRRRTWLIRKRVIAGSVSAFACAWAIIFGQLASGHDPALAGNQRQAAASSSTSSATSDSSSTSSSSPSTSDGGDLSSDVPDSSSQGSQQSSLPPVTTQQS